MPRLSDREKIEVVRLYQHGKTCQQIANKFGVVGESIRSLLKRRGIPRRRRKYTADEHFFDNVDNEMKAYWLGFLFADGNISGTTVSIALNKKDVDHLEKFSKSVSRNQPLEFRDSNNSYKAKVHSRYMAERLKVLGCVERKSKVIDVPSIDNDLLPHFYRGHFDGDGWITYRMQSGKWKTWQCGVASQSYMFLKKLHQWVIDQVGKNFGSLYQRGDKKCWCLDFSGKRSTLSFLNLLYGEASIFLDRKMKLYRGIA